MTVPHMFTHDGCEVSTPKTILLSTDGMIEPQHGHCAFSYSRGYCTSRVTVVNRGRISALQQCLHLKGHYGTRPTQGVVHAHWLQKRGKIRALRLKETLGHLAMLRLQRRKFARPPLTGQGVLPAPAARTLLGSKPWLVRCRACNSWPPHQTAARHNNDVRETSMVNGFKGFATMAA